MTVENNRFISVNAFAEANPDTPQDEVLASYTVALSAHAREVAEKSGMELEDMRTLSSEELVGRLAAEATIIEAQQAA